MYQGSDRPLHTSLGLQLFVRAAFIKQGWSFGLRRHSWGLISSVRFGAVVLGTTHPLLKHQHPQSHPLMKRMVWSQGVGTRLTLE